jgi:hypothetical protein
MEKEFDLKDAEDLCVGATILGTGGGGPLETGLSYFRHLLNRGKTIRMISVEDVPDEAIVVHPSGVGSIAPSKKGTRRQWNSTGEDLFDPNHPLLSGLALLEESIGTKVHAIVPVEIGGMNTALAALLASLAERPFVDADTIGRAKPELEMQSYTLYGIPITPMILFDGSGNTVIVKSVADYGDAERIARSLSILWGGATGVRCPVKGSVFKKSIIPGRVSKSVEIGKARRKAIQRGGDTLEAVLNASGGVLLFQGEVTRFEWEDRGGFMYGTVEFTGRDRFEGHGFKIWMKNENLISWIDEEPYVMSPDLICAVETDGAKPFTNDEIRKGMDVTVFGIPPHPLWRTQEGIELVSARHFGYDLPYRPLEAVIKAF